MKYLKCKVVQGLIQDYTPQIRPHFHLNYTRMFCCDNIEWQNTCDRHERRIHRNMNIRQSTQNHWPVLTVRTMFCNYEIHGAKQTGVCSNPPNATNRRRTRTYFTLVTYKIKSCSLIHCTHLSVLEIYPAGFFFNEYLWHGKMTSHCLVLNPIYIILNT